MIINVTTKQLGKKRPIGTETIEIEDLKENSTLSHLIKNIVKQQVTEFNKKRETPKLLSFLSKQEIDKQTLVGKVSFRDIYNTEKADILKAIDNALLAFEDGLYCVFIDDNQIEKLDNLIHIKQNSSITFVRLTFLAGSIW